MDQLKKFQELKEKKEKLEKEKIVLETKLSSLQGEADTLLEEIQDQFQVSSIEEAEELLNSQSQEIENDLKTIADKLLEYERNTGGVNV